MSTYHTIWSHIHQMPYHVAVHGASFPGSGYAGPVVRSRSRPFSYSTETDGSKENRLFFLDRSVFDLVDANQHLALTGPELLGWYIALSLHDRQIILDEGGFQLFLERHPALLLSGGHVFVKYHTRSFNTDQATMTSNVSQSRVVCRDPNVLGSVSVDMDSSRRSGKPELWTQTASTDDQKEKVTHAEVSPLQSEWLVNEKESSPEYNSCDRSIRPSAERGSQDELVCGEEDTVGEHEAHLSFEDETDMSHGVMEDDSSILVCLPREAVTRDVMVGTEPTLSLTAVTQTREPGTSDKNVITEVHMADLDYVAEEFIKLKMANEELTEKKEKSRRSGGELRQECDCLQRVQRAELCLLALQHCWRLYYTSTEGGHISNMLNVLPANIVSVQQQLDSDYNQMRDQILAGVPLEQLKPPSADSEKITTGATYVPAQSQNREELMKTENKAIRAAALVPRDVIQTSKKPEEKQTPAGKDVLSSEVWYDAEEDLHPVIETEGNHGSADEEVGSSFLCVTNLPSDVTESELLLRFD